MRNIFTLPSGADKTARRTFLKYTGLKHLFEVNLLLSFLAKQFTVCISLKTIENGHSYLKCKYLI